MKKILKIIAMVAVMTGFAACTDDNKTSLPQDGREIVYTVSSKVSRTALASDSEWDELLDRFCSYAQEGEMVTFYSVNRIGQTGSKAATKENTSITTTSREEVKDWMRQMEKAGKTVTVTYDRESGTWNGTAYSTGPQGDIDSPQGQSYTGVLVKVVDPLTALDPRAEMMVWALQVSDDSTLILFFNNVMLTTDLFNVEVGGRVCEEGETLTLHGEVNEVEYAPGLHILMLNMSDIPVESIVGRWHYYSMTSYTFTNLFTLSEETLYTPESVGNTIYYDFASDGSASRSRMPLGGSTADIVNEGTWSLSGNSLCCNLFDGENCWTVQDVAGDFMLLRQAMVDAQGNVVVYLMLLRKASN